MTKQLGIVALTLLFLLSIDQSAAGTDTVHDGLPPPVAGAIPALVRIYVVMESPSGGRMEKQRGAGSGAIISAQGHVVTNHHVAGNASHLLCTLADHTEVPATLVGTDPLSDIAVLQLDLSMLQDRQLPVAHWGDSDRLAVGDAVYALGSPAAISQSVTQGIVANRCMIMPEMMEQAFQLDGENVGSIVRWIAHDATIYGGNSGGPLVNAAGEIIGINEIGFAGLSGAIPGNLAKSMVSEIISHGHVPRAWSGMTLQERLEGGTRGALISSIEPGSPAAEAGLAVGDVLLRVGSVVSDCGIAEDVPVVTASLLSLPPEQTLGTTYLRNGEEHSTTLTLRHREPAQYPAAEVDLFGATVRDTTRSLRRRLDLQEQAGVLVDSVRAGGPAASATPPLEPGDVVVAIDSTPVRNTQHLRALVQERTATTVGMTLRRGAQDFASVIRFAAAAEHSPPARPRRAWLPVKTQVVTASMAQALQLGDKPGVRVTQTLAPSLPLQVGDLILAVAGKPLRVRQLKDKSALRRLLEQHDVGESVALTVSRNGDTLTIDSVLAAAPTPADLLQTFENEFLEFECRNPGELDAAVVSSRDASGVIVTEVARGGWADLGGLREKDRLLSFAGHQTPDVEALQRASRAAANKKQSPIIVLIERNQRTRFLKLEPVWE